MKIFRIMVIILISTNVMGNECPIVDSDFRLVELVNIGAPGMQFEFDKSGNVYMADKNGGVWKFDITAQTHKKIGTIGVSNPGYIGLLGFTLDPNFDLNKRVYLLYNSSGTDYSPFSVSRFTLDVNENLDLNSEIKILEIPNQNYGGGNYAGTPEGGHTGGKLTFGPGNLLYITTGDNCAWAEYGQLDERELTSTALYTSGNTNSLSGKILRIKIEDDGKYTIPSGNLFPQGTEKTRPEIFAMGMRNPYSIHVDDKTNWLFIGESGPQGALNNSRGPAGGEEYTIVKEPGNHGWPLFYGSNTPYARYDYATSTVGALFDPLNPVNESKWNTGLINLPRAQPASIHMDKFVADTSALDMGGNSGVGISGPLYRYDPDLNSSIKFPAGFHRTWFLSDYAKGKMGAIELSLDGDSLINKSAIFRTMNFASILDLKFGPDGSLYTLHHTGRLTRVEYTGTQSTPEQCGLTLGCTDSKYTDYNPLAEFDDGTCQTLDIHGKDSHFFRPDISLKNNSLIIKSSQPFKGKLWNLKGELIQNFSGVGTLKLNVKKYGWSEVYVIQIKVGNSSNSKLLIHQSRGL